MKTFRLLAAALLLTLVSGHHARALEAYPSNLTGQFMDWCGQGGQYGNGLYLRPQAPGPDRAAGGPHHLCR